MRKRYLAMFMSMVIACTQIAGSITVVHAEELIVEEMHEHVDTTDEVLTAEAEPEAAALEIEDVELIAEPEELPGEYVSIEDAGEISGGELDASESISEDISEDVPEDVSEDAPEDISGDVPEDAEVQSEEAADLNLTEELITSVEEVSVVPTEVLADGEQQEIVPEYNYGYPDQDPGDADLIPGWTKEFYDYETIGAWYKDSEHPDGCDTVALLENMEIIGQWTDASKTEPATEAVVELVRIADKQKWELTALSGGYAEVTLTHKSINPAEQESIDYTIGYFVHEGIYTLGWNYPDDMQSVLRGNTISVDSDVRFQYTDEHNNIHADQVDDYRLTVSEDEEEGAFNTHLLDAAVLEDGKTIEITAFNETGNARVKVDVHVNHAGEGEAAKYEYVTTRYLYVDVMDGYRVLRFKNAPADLSNLNLGDTLDLASWEPVVYDLFAGKEDTVVTENIQYRLQYDENAWEVSDTDAEIPALTRKGDWGTGVYLRVDEIIVDAEENERWSEFDCESFWFDELNYWTDFQYSYGEAYEDKVFTDTPLRLTLNTEGLNGLDQKEDYSVKWFVHGDQEVSKDSGEADFDGFTVKVDNSSAVITAIKGHDGESFNIRAEVYCGDMFVTNFDRHIEVKDARIEYNLPENQSMLLEWYGGFDRRNNGRFFDSKNPQGKNFEYEVTDMEVTVLPDSNSENVLEWGTDENGNYWYRAKDYGAVQVKLTWAYLDEDITGYPNTEQYVFDIYVNGDIYTLHGSYPDNMDHLLCGETLDIETWLQWEYFREDEGHRDVEVTDYELRVTPEPDNNLIEVDIPEGNIIHVTANNENVHGRTGFEVTAWVEGEPRTSAWFEVQVTDEYNVIRLKKGEPGNRHIGESLDFASLDPVVSTYIKRDDVYQYDQEQKDEDIRWRLEYDENAWTASWPEPDTEGEPGAEGDADSGDGTSTDPEAVSEGETGSAGEAGSGDEAGSEDEPGANPDPGSVPGTLEELPTLTRINTGGGTNVTLVAYVNHSEDGDENWQEICRRDYHFGRIEYGVDFEYLYGSREESFVYSDREQVLTLNTDGLSGLDELEGYRVKWYVNDCLNGEGQDEAVSVTLDENNPETIKLAVPEGADEYDIHVAAKVYNGDKEVISTETGFRMKQAKIEYELPESKDMLPGWDDGFEIRNSGCIYNSEYLHGEEFEFDITEVTIEGVECEAKDVLDWGTDDRGNYGFHAKANGTVKISCQYNDPDGNPVKEPHVFWINVTGDIYRLHGEYQNDSNLLICGGTLNIETRLQWQYLDENGEDQDTDVNAGSEAGSYTLQVVEENGPDEDLVTVATEDDGTIVVTANNNANYGHTGFEVAAVVEDEIVASIWLEVEVTEDYHVISLDTLNGEFPDPLLGEVLDIASMGPAVYAYANANTEQEEMKGVLVDADKIRWRLEYDENAWRADDPNAEIPKLTRIRNWDTKIKLIAEKNYAEDGGEDWQEVRWRQFWFGTHDYHVEPQLKYGEYHEEEPGIVYIGEGQDQILTLKTEGLNGLEGYEVRWYVWDEGNDMEVPSEHVSFEIQDTETGHQILLDGLEGHGGTWFIAGAEIWYENDVVTSFDIGMDVRDTVYEANLPFDMTWLPRWEDAIGGHRKVWAEDAEHPNGANIPYTITAVQVDLENSDEGVFSYDINESGFITPDEDGNFWFYAESFGEVKLICTYVFDADEQTEYKHELIFAVGEKTYGFDADYPLNSSGMLTGSSMDIETYVWIDGYDIDRDEHYREDIAEYELEIDPESYDQELIQAEVDGSVIHVNAFDKHGDTHIRATAKVDGEVVAEQHFHVGVTDDLYRLSGDYPDDTDLLVCGDTLEIDTWLQREYLREEAGYRYEEVTNYALQMINEPDKRIVNAAILDNNNILVTANNEGVYGRTDFEVAAFVEGEERARVWFNVEVTGGYNVIRLTGLEGEFPDPMLGDTIDIASMEPTVYVFENTENEKTDGEAIPAENIRWRLEYDENAWRADDPNAEIPKLTRIRNWDTKVKLIAEMDCAEGEEEDWQEISSRQFRFGAHDYHVEPQLKYGSTDRGVVYIGEDQDQMITLNMDGLNGLEDYKVKWYVWDDGNDMEVPSDHVTFTTDNTDSVHLIQLYGKEGHGGSRIAVRAEVWYEGNEITSFEIGMDVRDTVYEANLPFDTIWLPGWEDAIGGHRKAWIEDAEHPDGADVPYTITAVQVDLGNSDEGVFSYDIDENGFIAPDKEGNFCFRAESFGVVKLICTYVFDEDEQQTEYKHALIFEVAEKSYGFDANYPMNSSGMLLGSSMDIATYVWVDGYDIDRDEHYREDLAEYELEIDPESYDQELIQAEVDGSVIHVTAFDKHGDTHIRATAKVDGEVVAEQNFHVWVTGDLYRLSGDYQDDMDQMLCGSSFEIDTWLQREYLHEEEGYHYEEVSNYALQLVDEPDTNLVNVEILRNNNILVTANNEGVYGRTGFEVAAFVEGEERARVRFNAAVTDGYQVIRLDKLDGGRPENCHIDNTVKFGELEPTLYLYDSEKTAGEARENIRWTLEYDENAWTASWPEAVSEGETGSEQEFIPMLREELPTLTRINTGWGTDVTLIAYENHAEDGGNDWHEVCRRGYHFGEINYGVDFEYLYGNRQESAVYADRAQVLTLNTEGLNGLTGYDVRWYVNGSLNGEGQEDSVSVTLDEQNPEIITLEVPEGHDDYEIHVVAQVYYGDRELTGTDTRLWIKQVRTDYELPDHEELLPYWDSGLDRDNHKGWFYNSWYPSGQEFRFEITGMEVNGINNCNENEVLEWGLDDNNNYYYRAKDYGSVEITLNWQYTDGDTTNYPQEEPYVFEVHVNSDTYRLEGDYPDDMDLLMYGKPLTIDTWLQWDYFREENGHRTELVEGYQLQLRNEPDTELITVELQSDKIIVTANSTDRHERTGFEVVALIEDAENPEGWTEVASRWFDVVMTDGYQVIRLDKLDGGKPENCHIDNTVKFGELEPTLYLYDGEKTAGEARKNIRWTLEYDENVWTASWPEPDTEGEPGADSDAGIPAEQEFIPMLREELPTLTRTNTEDGTDVFLTAYENRAKDGGNDWHEVCSRGFRFDEINYEVDINYLYGHREESFVYTDCAQVLTLNTDGLNGLDELEGYRVEWYVNDCLNGEDQEEAVSVTLDETNPEIITLAIPENKEDLDYEIHVEAKVYYGDRELTVTETSLWPRQSGFDFELPDHEEMLLYWDFGFEKGNHKGWFYNSEYPGGQEFGFEITDMEVLDTKDSAAKDVLKWGVDENGNYWYHAKDYGHVQIKLTWQYTDDDTTNYPQEEPYVFDLYVNGDIYRLHGDYQDDLDLLVCGDTLTIDTWLQWEYFHNDEEGHKDVKVEDYVLGIINQPDTELVTVAFENNEIHVTANSEGRHGRTSFEVAAYIKNEETQAYDIEVTRSWFEVEVKEGYHVIRLTGLEGEFPNPLLGEELNIAAMEPAVFEYVNSEHETIKGAQEENIRWRLEYDEDAWAVSWPETDTEGESGTEPETDAEGEAGSEPAQNQGLPILTRIRNWDTEIKLIAEMDCAEGEEEDWQEISSRQFGFASHDYHVEPQLEYGEYHEEEPGIVYIGEGQDQILTLKTEGLNSLEGYEVKWYVWDDGNDREAPSEHVTFKAQDTGAGHQIILDGREGHGGSWFMTAAEIWYEGDVVTRFDIGMDVRDTVYDYRLPGDMTWLPRWEDGIGGHRKAWVEDAARPEGDEVEYQITKVQVDLENSDEGVFAYDINEDGSINPDEEGNFWFSAERYGAVKLTCTFVFDGKTYTHDLVFEVAGSTYGLDADYPMDSDGILTGGSMDIETYVWVDGYDIDLDEHYQEDVTGYVLEIDQASYDHELIEAEVNGSVISVNALDKHGETYIRATAKVDGEVVAEQHFHVWVTDYYTDLEPTKIPKSLENLMPGDELSLEAFGENLKAYYCKVLDDGTEGRGYYPDAEFVWAADEMDPEIWHVTEDGRYIRKRPGGTNIVIEARFTDVHGNKDSTRRGFWLPEADTGIEFAYSYGNRDMESIYVGENEQPQTLTLDTQLPITENGYRVEWRLDQYLEEADENTSDVTAVDWTESTDGTSLTLTAKEGQAGEWINVYAEVYYDCGGEEILISEARTGMRVEEPVYCMTGLGINELDMVISGGLIFPGYNEETRSHEDEIFIQNSSVPMGTEIPVVISNMTYSYKDDESVDPVNDNYIQTSMTEEGWLVQFMEAGDYTVTMDVQHAETQEVMEDIVLQVYVHDVMHYVEVEPFGDTAGAAHGIMLLDDSIQLNTKLIQITYDAETNERIREEIEADSWKFEYDESMVRVSEDGVITAAGINRGGTWVEAVAETTINGNKEEIRDGLHIEITGRYFMIEPGELYLVPRVEAQKLDVTLKKYCITKPEGVITDERTVTAVGWDENQLSVENTEEGIFVSTPLLEVEEPFSTFVALEALDEDGDSWAYTEAEIMIGSHETTESVTTAPTCQTTGQKHVTCTKCGLEWDEEIPVIACIEDDGTQTIDPTCTENGTMEYRCTMCKAVVRTESVDALGHSFTKYMSDGNATCAADGTKTAVCDREGCGETDTVADEGSKLEHSFITYVYDEGSATCEADGTKTAVCEYCNETKTVTAEGTKLDHVFTLYTSNDDATCAKDGTETAACTWGCKETDTRTEAGSKLAHSFGVYVPDNNATCTSDGTKTASCVNGCGQKHTIRDAGSALGHEFEESAYTSNNDANCTSDGTETAKCSRCDAVDTRKAENTKISHEFAESDYEYDEGSATCTLDGTKTAECSYGCGMTNTMIAEDTATGHTYKVTKENPATCTADGEKVSTCETCSHVKTEVLSAAGHDFEEATPIPATEEADGKEYEVCKNCQEEVITKVLLQLAKDEEISDLLTGLDETATAETVDAAVESVSGMDNTDLVNSTDGMEVISALEEKLTDDTAGKAAVGTTVAGSTDTAIDDVSVAGAAVTVASEIKKNEALNEEETYNAAIVISPPKATRTLAALTEETVGLNSYTVDIQMNINNSSGETVVSNVQPAAPITITMSVPSGFGNGTFKLYHINGNVTEEVKYTRNTDNTITFTAVSLSPWMLVNTSCLLPNGLVQHTLNPEACTVVPATCKAAGSRTGTCTVCFEPNVTEVIPKLTAHGETETVTQKAATCWEDGSEHQICKVCGEVVGRTVLTKTGNHNWNAGEPTVEATCISDGNLKQVCQTVGCTAVNNVVIPKTGEHRYAEEFTVDETPTCTEPGSKSKHCITEGCKAISEETVIPAAHTYAEEDDAYVTETTATCTSKGTEVKKCTVEGCGYVADRRETSMLSHTYAAENDGYVTETAATCTRKGTEVKKCTNCGTAAGKRETNMLPHTYAEDANEYVTEIPATCTSKGTEVKKCTGCGNVGDRRETAKLPHTYATENDGYVTETAATCTSKGTEVKKCTECGDIADRRDTDMLPHDLVDKITLNPTCGEAGSQYKECENCDYEGSAEPIPATGQHAYKTVVDKPATCGAAGSQHKECTNCDYIGNAETIKATGSHTYKTVVDKAATCTAAGSQHKECKVCGQKQAAETIAKTAHKYKDNYVVTKEATCLAAGEKTRYCTECKGAPQKAAIPKLAGTVTPAASKLTMKMKDTVKASELVSGLMEGDYITNVTTSNKKLVTVKKSGKDWKITGKTVTSKKTGTAKITITLASGASANITFSVQKANVKTSSLKVTNASKKLTLTTGDSLVLETLVKPVTTTDKLTFSTSNKKIVTVSKSGELKAKKAGTATITVKSGKKSVKIKVTVKAPLPTAFKLSKETLSLKAKKSATLKVKFTPGSSEAKVTFKTSNKKVATVSKTGKVTAKKKGTAIITATVKSATGETLTRTCKVTVK